MTWENTRGLESKAFVCGYCGNQVASDKGYHSLKSKPTRQLREAYSVKQHSIYICPHCVGPNIFFENGLRVPDEFPGTPVKNLPDDVDRLYEEMGRCISASCYTAAVMLGRKLLMHIAVDKGAEENNQFTHYVDYLDKKNYLPPDAKDWVDLIRKQGNEANHEIVLKDKNSAMELMKFVEMLLRIIYEYSDTSSPDTSNKNS